MATYELDVGRTTESARPEDNHWTVRELEARTARGGGALIGAGGAVREAHSFRMRMLGGEPGRAGEAHGPDAPQVLVVHEGQWRVDLEGEGEGAQVYLSPGDVISVPGGTRRSLVNMGTSAGAVLAIEGGDAAAADGGGGRGYDNASAAGLVVRDAPVRGLRELVAPGAALGWAHGFLVSRIDLATGEAWDSLATPSAHVLWVHRGAADISGVDGLVALAAGEAISVPAAFSARITTVGGTVLFKVERFDDERLVKPVPQPGAVPQQYALQQPEDVRHAGDPV